VKGNLLARTRLSVAALATIGLLIGVVGGYVYTSSTKRFTAQATLAMLPSPDIALTNTPNFWEVLNAGQSTRTAAIVLGDNRWLDAAASAAGVSKSSLTLAAGAIPQTTLISVTMKADSARDAEVALDSVVTNALGPAAAASGPYMLQPITSPDGNARSTSPGRVSTIGALAIAGLLVGAGGGLLLSRSAQRRSVRQRGPAATRKHRRMPSFTHIRDQAGIENSPTADIPVR
jgi:hypothetical protein